MAEVTYPPLDIPKPLADDLWIVDSGHQMAGAPLPVRMTVLRLPDGALLLHSPTRYTQATQAALEQLGSITHLVAPNTAHWSYMSEWQKHVPAATYWAVPGLRKRRAVVKSGLRLDHDLPGQAEEVWQGAVKCILVNGLGISEAALFHHPSRSLVLTDLVVNVETGKLPVPLSLGARLVGSTAPHGKAPIYARMAFKLGGSEATEAARRIVALAPDRVIFAHGQCFEHDAAARLKESLSWLT
ncbi:MAG TPA: DUF4336 domain-containing protein [Devosia sp.]|uniref:DUF4336 domain-containing protein n=1 Tax=Devosia sp. TaxID=1871048 RepID=UPI002F955DBF